MIMLACLGGLVHTSDSSSISFQNMKFVNVSSTQSGGFAVLSRRFSLSLFSLPLSNLIFVFPLVVCWRQRFTSSRYSRHLWVLCWHVWWLCDGHCQCQLNIVVTLFILRAQSHFAVDGFFAQRQHDKCQGVSRWRGFWLGFVA